MPGRSRGALVAPVPPAAGGLTPQTPRPGRGRRIADLALTYLKRHNLLEYPARFDVVAVTWADDRREPVIEHFPNAFEAVGQWQLFG